MKKEDLNREKGKKEEWLRLEKRTGEITINHFRTSKPLLAQRSSDNEKSI